MRWLESIGIGRPEPISPDEADRLADSSALVAGVAPDARPRLHELVARFLRRKSIEGAQGFRPERDEAILIAAHACVPVLNLGFDWLSGWRSVIVYPDDFVASHEYTDEAGVLHREARELSGEAWDRGPVVLSWSTVAESLDPRFGGDVVVHEIAHKLDLLDGGANGAPPLHPAIPAAQWRTALASARDLAAERLHAENAPLFDGYAIDDPGEFFAVASELLFTDPYALDEDYPALYEALSRFYRQDPGGCFPRPDWCTPLAGDASPSRG